MAEFLTVMKKKEEICEYYGNCCECPLCSNNKLTCDDFINNDPKEAEEIIMNWQKPIDWNKVEVDTPILVRNSESDCWIKRYFAKYEDGKVFAWMNGATSWSIYDKNDVYNWKYTKLAEEVGVE